MEGRDFYGYTIYSNGDIENKHGRILKQRTKDGRSEIKLVINGERKNFITARLIYCVFNNIDVFELDKDQCISFKDNDKLNLSIENLYQVYRADLIQGDKHDSISKLSDKDVEDIKRKYNNTKDNRPINQYDAENPYNSYRSLAKEYDVTYTMIKHIIKGSARDESKYILKEEE